MKTNNMGDYPKLPDELKKELPEQLQADIPKRTGLIKTVRHRVKQILAKLTR